LYSVDADQFPSHTILNPDVPPIPTHPPVTPDTSIISTAYIFTTPNPVKLYVSLPLIQSQGIYVT
jgi:hypothetical protein